MGAVFTIAADDGNLAPDRVLLLRDGPLGWAEHPELKLTPAGAKNIIEDFKRQGNKLVIDYHHQTVDEEEGTRDTAPAAGYIGGLEYIAGKGLFATKIEWTPKAKELLENGEYKYHSPVVYWDGQSKELLQLHSVALTNNPATMHMWEISKVAAELGRRKIAGKRKKVAAQDEVVTEVDLLASLREKLGLPEDATLEDVLLAAIQTLGGGMAPGGEPSSEEEGASEFTARAAAYDALTARIKSLEQKIGDLNKEREEKELNSLIDEQVEAGKILPDDTKMIAAARSLAKKNRAEFVSFCASMPAIVEPGSVLSGKTHALGGRAAVIKRYAAEYDGASTTIKAVTKRRHYINAALQEDEAEPLSASEIEELEKPNGRTRN